MSNKHVTHIQQFWSLPVTEKWVTIASLVALPCLHISLRLVGFRRLYRWLHRWPTNYKSALGSGTLSPQRTAFLIHTVSRLGPFPTNCLPRSLWLYWWLKRYHTHVEIWIGVPRQTSDFEAHAWVTHHNIPLAESDQVLQKYLPILASNWSINLNKAHIN
ncbi:MAG TPA: lasso peptide biosynthesis B2 protein [Anaerolineae bacterium]|nr:lasso peptide biosynthesis B2 protein [Anaerolineae bacterium]